MKKVFLFVVFMNVANLLFAADASVDPGTCPSGSTKITDPDYCVACSSCSTECGSDYVDVTSTDTTFAVFKSSCSDTGKGTGTTTCSQ